MILPLGAVRRRGDSAALMGSAGLGIAECQLLLVAWADDTWLVKSPAEFNTML